MDDSYLEEALGAFTESVLLPESEEYGDETDVRLGNQHYDSIDALAEDLPDGDDLGYAGFVEHETLETVAGDGDASVTKIVGPESYEGDQSGQDAVDELAWTSYLLDNVAQADSAGSTTFQSYEPFLTVDEEGQYTALLVSAQTEHVPCMGSKMSLPHVVYAVHGDAAEVPEGAGDVSLDGVGTDVVPEEPGPEQYEETQEQAGPEQERSLPDQLEELESVSDVMPKITNFDELVYEEQEELMDRAAEDIEDLDAALGAYDGFTNAWLDTRAADLVGEDEEAGSGIGYDEQDLARYRDAFADAVGSLAGAEPGEGEPMDVMEEVFLSSLAVQAITDEDGFRRQYRQDSPDAHDTVMGHGRKHRDLTMDRVLDMVAPTMQDRDGDVADLGQMMREVVTDGPRALDEHFEAYQDQIERQQSVRDQREQRNTEVIYQ